MAVAVLRRPVIVGAMLALTLIGCRTNDLVPEPNESSHGVAGYSSVASVDSILPLDRDLIDQALMAAPGTVFEVSSSPELSKNFVTIPAGDFVMGSPEDEEGRLAREGPRRTVVIERPFLLGETPVTQAQWEFVMGTNPSAFEGSRRPVDSVSWNQAHEYCRRLSAALGQKVRLPTEAEWEYAVRAGTKGARYGPVAQIAWFEANSGAQTRDVGLKRPNPWGLYDMLGNVWEWCRDANGRTYEGAPVDGTAREGIGTRVLRGGSWMNSADFCRAAVRIHGGPDMQYEIKGFRVVLEPSSGEECRDARPHSSYQSSEEGGVVLSLAETVSMPFVRIPPGRFLMGSPDDEEGRESNEGPQRMVVFEEPFLMATTPVTQEQWMAVMDDNPSQFRGSRHPVDSVSWYDARSFCEKVARQTGLAIRLPSESEWEYAARAGTDGPWYGELDEIAWYEGTSSGRTHTVAEKLPNPWGLYDMLGNVWEWCEDKYVYLYLNAPVDGRPVEGEGNRVLRGGSWRHGARFARAAFRLIGVPAYRYDYHGFRPVIAPVPDE